MLAALPEPVGFGLLLFVFNAVMGLVFVILLALADHYLGRWCAPR